MTRTIGSYGALGAFGLAAALFVLGRFGLSALAMGIALLLGWLLGGAPLQMRVSPEGNSSPARSHRLAMLCFWGAIAAFVAIDLLVSLSASSIFDGMPFDGPFQSYNPLRRIANGELPLVDFKYFHGNLLPLLLYPFYALFGKDLFAAEMARHLLDLIMFGLATAILGRGLFPERLYRRLFYVLFLAISLSGVVMTELHNPILGVHSTIVRTFPQMIAFAVTMRVVGHARDNGPRLLLEAIAAGAGAAVVFLFTNEHGIYLAATVAVVLAVWGPAPLSVRLVAAVALVLAFASVLLGVETVLDWHGPLAALQNIAADQVWYFGSYPNFFITRLSDLWQNAGIYQLALGIVRLFAVAALAAWVVWPMLRERRKEAAGLLALMVYGGFATVSNLGYLGLHYFDPLVRALVVALIYFFYLAGRHPQSADHHAIQRTVFQVAADVLKCVRVNFFAVVIGVAGALWLSAKPLFMSEALDGLPHLPKNEALGVHLPDASWGAGSRWAHWVDEAIANTLLLGRGDAARLAGYGNTVAGTEGPFRNGVVNVVCLELGRPIPQGVSVGDSLRVGSERWPLLSIGANRLDICAGVYSADQFAAARQLDQRGKAVTNISFERVFTEDGNGVVLTDFNEVGPFKINGIYLDRPAVILHTKGKRVGVARGALPQVGDTLVFFSSGARKVVAVYPTGYVELDRGGLDPYRDGYPRPIRLIKAGGDLPQNGPYLAKTTFAGGIFLVSPKVRPYLSGTEVWVPEIGRSYDVVSATPEGMLFLSDFVRLDESSGSILRNVWYRTETGENRYYTLGGGKSEFPRNGVPDVWSTYTGLPDAMAGELNPFGTDYIIHALGDDRQRYLDRFRRQMPDIFISMRSIPAPIWNEWLQVNHWGLFRLALERYGIAASSLHSIYWLKRERAQELEIQPVLESSGGGVLELGSVAAGCNGRRYEFVEVDIRYRFDSELAWLPILGSSPRAFVYPQGAFAGIPVSLNPRANRMTFPVLFLCDGRRGIVRFGLEGIGAKFARLQIERVRLGRIENHHAALEELFGVTQAARNIPYASALGVGLR